MKRKHERTGYFYTRDADTTIYFENGDDFLEFLMANDHCLCGYDEEMTEHDMSVLKGETDEF